MNLRVFFLVSQVGSTAELRRWHLFADILLHFSTSYESKSQILGGITQG